MVSTRLLAGAVVVVPATVVAFQLLAAAYHKSQAALREAQREAAALQAQVNRVNMQYNYLEAELLHVKGRLGRSQQQNSGLRLLLRDAQRGPGGIGVIAAAQPGLPDLPPAVLELICQPLILKDRWALARSCRALFDLLFQSTVLWGNLTARLGADITAAQEEKFCAWLFERQNGIRGLQLERPRPCPLPRGVVALSGSGIRELLLFKAAFVEPWHLPRLPALYRLALTECTLDFGFISSALATLLPALLELELCRCHFVSGVDRSHPTQVLVSVPENPPEDIEAAFTGLSCLRPLTRLMLAACGVKQVPMQLSELSELKELVLYGNQQLEDRGQQCSAGFQALQHLTALTSLCLGGCGLVRLPPQLACVSTLRAFDISSNSFGGADVRGALHAIQHLTHLTSLDLSMCSLHALPDFLYSLKALASLNLQNNDFGVVDTENSLQPLRHLAGLTRLDLAGCQLPALPACMSSLTQLADLDLACNEFGPQEGAQQVELQLPTLTALTRLSLSECLLDSLPPSISALASLQDLNLSGNSFAAAGPGCLHTLRQLTGITQLDLTNCHLTSWPESIACLRQLKKLHLAGNGFWAPHGAYTFRVVGHPEFLFGWQKTQRSAP